jgi:MOSC domain-containing protein YiiM
MASLVSVNVGMPRDVAWQGKTVHTGIWKSPVTGPQTVRRLNIDGDGQGDKSGHGGENRAVFVYQLDSYRYWEQHLGRDDLEYGNFGENLTVEGMADSEVCVGDRYRIGSAEFEVTQPRVTCFRVGMRLDRPDMPSLLVDHNRPGFYMRVIIEGVIEAGGEIVKTANGPNQISVADIDALVGARNSAQLTRPADIRGAGRRACLVFGRCWSRLLCVGSGRRGAAWPRVWCVRWSL